MTVYLDLAQVVAINEGLGGGGLVAGSRAGLEAAVSRPQSGFGDVEAFPDLWSKAGALLHGLCSTQYFLDGNKRTAWLATVAFLQLNRIVVPRLSDVEAEAFVLAVATVRDFDASKAAEWFRAYCGASQYLIRGGALQLHDLVRDSDTGVVQGLHAVGVTFHGPAIVYGHNGTSFLGCTWVGAGSESIAWEISDVRTSVVGAVVFDDCLLDACVFDNVGFAGRPEAIAKFFGATTV